MLPHKYSFQISTYMITYFLQRSWGTDIPAFIALLAPVEQR